MSTKWEKVYPEEYLRRDLRCAEFRVDENHTVMILSRDKCYDSYVMWHSTDGHSSTPFMFMFGTLAGSMSYHEIVDMTITVAPDYYHLCEEGY